MSMHASIAGERCGHSGSGLERRRAAVARQPPFPSVDAAGVPPVDLVGIDRVLRTFYAALSGEPGPRWHQFRALFERGSWVRAGDEAGVPVEEYIRRARDDEPRTLVELDRAIRVDGELAFVASAYRAFGGDGKAVLGVNEFLLRKTEARWRIAGTTADHRDVRRRRADAH